MTHRRTHLWFQFELDAFVVHIHDGLRRDGQKHGAARGKQRVGVLLPLCTHDAFLRWCCRCVPERVNGVSNSAHLDTTLL